MRPGPVFALVGALLLAAAPPPARAQHPTLGDTTVLGLAPAPFVALSVANLDTMVAWYHDVLGFRVYSKGTTAGGRGRAALLLRGTALLEILEFADSRSRSEIAPGLEEGHIRGFFKSGFVVADLDRVYAGIRRRGVKIEFAIVRPPGGPYRTFGLRDPEGNLIQFFGR